MALGCTLQGSYQALSLPLAGDARNSDQPWRIYVRTRYDISSRSLSWAGEGHPPGYPRRRVHRSVRARP